MLEGGQDKENQKRDEIFYNETLAPDEIDRLFEPKVLTNFKKYDVKGEHKVTDFNVDDNLIIKGNNLLALHCLKQKYRGKVKLIYIDPPYNTGNDGFNYNDKFKHSSWLAFMKNRLEIAKEFLRDDGVVFVQCDDNEQAYLKVLMDEIFRKENFVGDLIRKTKSTTNDAKVGFNIQHENTLIFAKYKKNLILHGQSKSLDNYSNPDNDPNGDWISSDPSARTGNIKFEIKNPYTGKVDLPPKGRCWAFSKERFNEFVKNGKIKFKTELKNNERGFIYKRYKKAIKSLFHLLNSLEGCKNKYMNQVATKEKNILFAYDEFSYPKPEEFLKLIINASTAKNDLILDFFAGSGTTLAVAHKMGRRYIGIEQMDYIENIALERLKKVIAGEQGGISNLVNFQGGGSFNYAELMKWNEKYMQDIKDADTSLKVLNIYEKMKKEAFFRYDIELTKFDENEFAQLSLKDQKQVLCKCLDKNHLYVNLSEIEDATYKVSSNDKKLNKKFYRQSI